VVCQPLKLTTVRCARHCCASAPQCPARAQASLVHHPPPPASVRTQANSAAQWHCPDPQTSAGSGLLSGQHHRAAKWFITASSSPPPVAPGTAALGRVNARLTQRAPCSTSHGLPAPPPHRATRTRFARPPGHPATDFVRRSAFSKAGSLSQRFACVSQSAGALHPRSRLASHRVDHRGPSQRMSHASLLHNAPFA
jgi:hypothetical protein